jgi:hypothetical protein
VNTRDPALSRAEAALERERRAIVSLDIDEVERAAEEKQAAFKELCESAALGARRGGVVDRRETGRATRGAAVHYGVITWVH